MKLNPDASKLTSDGSNYSLLRNPLQKQEIKWEGNQNYHLASVSNKKKSSVIIDVNNNNDHREREGKKEKVSCVKKLPKREWREKYSEMLCHLGTVSKCWIPLLWCQSMRYCYRQHASFRLYYMDMLQRYVYRSRLHTPKNSGNRLLS